MNPHGIPIVEVKTRLCKDSTAPNVQWYESEIRIASGRTYHFRQWFRTEEFLIGSFVEYVLRAQMEGLKEGLEQDISLGERYTP